MTGMKIVLRIFLIKKNTADNTAENTPLANIKYLVDGEPVALTDDAYTCALPASQTVLFTVSGNLTTNPGKIQVDVYLMNDGSEVLKAPDGIESEVHQTVTIETSTDDRADDVTIPIEGNEHADEIDATPANFDSNNWDGQEDYPGIMNRPVENAALTVALAMAVHDGE